MKITEIKTFLCHAYRTNWVFVKVMTDDGIYGVGEATLEYKEHAVIAAIHELDRVLIGKDPHNIEAIWHDCYRDAYWRGGPVLMSALASLEMALWDIKGKALGVPVYDLFGGKYRDKIRVWRHITPNNDYGLFKALLLEAKEEGFTAVRINPCRDMTGWATSKRLSTMYNRIAFAREVLGDEMDIAIEIHRELNGDESLMLCKMLESAGNNADDERASKQSA